MDYQIDRMAGMFTAALDQVSALSIAQAFMLAGVVLVGFLLLLALAMLASRWISHGIDSIFEWLLLLGLGGAIAWLLLRGFPVF